MIINIKCSPIVSGSTRNITSWSLANWRGSTRWDLDTLEDREAMADTGRSLPCSIRSPGSWAGSQQWTKRWEVGGGEAWVYCCSLFWFFLLIATLLLLGQQCVIYCYTKSILTAKYCNMIVILTAEYCYTKLLFTAIHYNTKIVLTAA